MEFASQHGRGLLLSGRWEVGHIPVSHTLLIYSRFLSEVVPSIPAIFKCRVLFIYHFAKVMSPIPALLLRLCSLYSPLGHTTRALLCSLPGDPAWNSSCLILVNINEQHWGAVHPSQCILVSDPCDLPEDVSYNSILKDDWTTDSAFCLKSLSKFRISWVPCFIKTALL